MESITLEARQPGAATGALLDVAYGLVDRRRLRASSSGDCGPSVPALERAERAKSVRRVVCALRCRVCAD